ncbi:MAG: ABC transporter substrate-binding protein [Clostridia bacterium]|nr:ABC transporter substrate-binding protein [Clostridia bacterium]
MRYHIDTIPIWDAVKLDGECPLCSLERKTELGEAERYLGASVMEPDIRIKVNDKGFCRKHHTMLFSMSNRLGHALMLESHTIENRKKTAQIFEKMNRAAEQLIQAGLGDKLSGKTRNAAAVITGEAGQLTELSGTCLMCETIRENMLRYLHTFFHLYKQDRDFSARIAGGKGFCLPHTGQLIAVAAEELNSRELGEFIRMITRLETENLERIQEDISWFIKKFDYRYEAESWKNSKDAVERTVNKTRGWCVGKEPVPEE